MSKKFQLYPYLFCISILIAALNGCAKNPYEPSPANDTASQAMPSNTSAEKEHPLAANPYAIPASEIVAKVGDIIITKDDVKSQIDQLIAMAQIQMETSGAKPEEIKETIDQFKKEFEKPENKKGILDQLVNEALLYIDAKAEGLDKERATAMQIDRFVRTLLSNKKQEKLLSTVVEPSEMELHTFYERNKQFLGNMPEKRLVYEIAFNNEQEAANVASQLLKGEMSFTAAARMYSVNDSKQDSGKVGELIDSDEFKQKYGEKYLKAAFSTDEKKISGIFQSDKDGKYYILTVREITPGKVMDWFEVKNDSKFYEALKSVYLQTRQADIMKDALDKIKQRVKVETFEQNL